MQIGICIAMSKSCPNDFVVVYTRWVDTGGDTQMLKVNHTRVYAQTLRTKPGYEG